MRYPTVLIIFLAFGLASCERYVSIVESDGELSRLSDGTVVDRDRGIVWIEQDSGLCIAADEVADHVASVGFNGVDWRLPTVDEVESLRREGDYDRRLFGGSFAKSDAIHDYIFLTNPVVWAVRSASDGGLARVDFSRHLVDEAVEPDCVGRPEYGAGVLLVRDLSAGGVASLIDR